MARGNHFRFQVGVLLLVCAIASTLLLLHFSGHGSAVDSGPRRGVVGEPQRGDRAEVNAPAPPPSLEVDRPHDGDRVVASEPRATLRISVHDSNGGPIGGCSISTGAASTETDAAGGAMLVLPPGRFYLDLKPGDQSPFEGLEGAINLPAGGTKQLDVVLVRREEFPFCVQVLSSKDGSPLANVEVRVSGDDAKVLTDVLGRACIEVRGSDEVVELYLPGFARRVVSADPGHEAASSALQVRLDEGAKLCVRAVDEKGVSIPDAEVEVRVHGVDETFPRYAPVRVERSVRHGDMSEDGTFPFVDLPLGAEVDVEATLAKDWLGNTEQRIVLRDPSTVLTMTVRPFRCVRGRVLDASGSAVQGVVARAERVRTANVPRMIDGPRRACWGDSAPTDSSGRFVIPHLEPGLWDVGSIGLEGILTTVKRVDVSLDADENVDLQVVPAEESITGVVVCGPGVPCPDECINAYAAGVQMASATTDDEGRFELKGLPQGEYDVEVEGSLSLKAKTGALPLTIQCPVDSHITGNLPAGLWWISAIGEGIVEDKSDLDGSFRLGPVPSGSWFDLYIRNSTGRVAMIRVQASRRAEPLVVDPKPGARLYLSDPVAERALITSGECRFATRMEQGSIDWHLVPAGNVTIEFQRGDGTALSTVATSLLPGEGVLVTRAGRVGQTAAVGSHR